MKLSNCEIIEARVVDNADPENLGRVRLVAPGEYQTDTCPKESIPWARPFFVSSSQTFSKPNEGDAVWHLYDVSDFSGMTNYYIPMPSLHDSTASLLGEPDAQVMMNVENGAGNSSIHYNSTSGLTMRVNNDGVNVGHGSTHIVGGNGKNVVSVTANNVSLGNSESATQPLVLSGPLGELFNDIVDSLNLISLDLIANGGIASQETLNEIDHIRNGLLNAVESVKCENVNGN